MAKRDRTKRLAKKRARREKRLQKRVAFYRRTALLAIGPPKISEALLDYAAPLLGEPPSEDLCAEIARPILFLAATIWNLTRLVDDGCAIPGEDNPDDMRLEIVEQLAQDSDHSRQECEALIDWLMQRKRDLFDDDPRIVLNVDVVDTDDGIHVLAACSI